MGEVYTSEGKIMNAIERPNMRQLVKVSNDMHIAREDVITILPTKKGYMMVFYYGGEVQGS